MAQVSELVLEFALAHLIPYIHQVTHRKLNKSALNAFKQRVAKINDEDEYDVKSTYNALRGFILNTPEKVYQSTCQMSDDELINLLTKFDAFNTWISCQIISLSKFAFEKNKAHNSVSLCIDEKKIKALLGFVPQMFCDDYPYKSVMFSGTVDDSGMPCTGWLKVNLHSEHGTTIVLYNGNFSNGLLDGLCVRLFKNAEDCTSYGTLPKCVQFFKCWKHLPLKLTHFCWGFYEGGRWAHGLEHFPLTNFMACTFASKDVVFRAIVDKGIMQNSKIVWPNPIKSLDEMLMHMALRYLCSAKCKIVEPYMPIQIRNLHMSLTKNEVDFLYTFVIQLSTYTDEFVSLVLAFFHFCKRTRPLPDNFRVTDRTKRVIGRMMGAYKRPTYLERIHFGYCAKWVRRMFCRWRASAKYVCKSRQRNKALSLALTHFRRLKHSLCKFFFKLFRNALISKSFRVWNKCHYGRRNTKKSVFTLWKQVTLRNIVTRFLIAGRRALVAPMQVHWYDFPCVFVRDYPRNKYDGRLEQNLFPGYVSKKHRNRWWFGDH